MYNTYKMDRIKLYTVGHSNQTQDEFLELIKSQGINCIIDVRSLPYSKYTSQFNSEVLKSYLNKNGIFYAHFGKEFGARRFDCLKDVTITKMGKTEIRSQVNFELGVKTEQFLKGVDRIKKALLQGRKVSLMCSEANPLGCHRFSFLSKYFYDLGWDVNHIVRDENTGEGTIHPHQELETKMIMDYVHGKKLREIDGQGALGLFCMSDFGEEYTPEEQRIDAYRLKNQEIGWSPTTNDAEESLID